MRKCVFAALAAVVVSQSVPAHAAFCIEPRSPSSTMFLRKPMKPYCASTRTCEAWEVEAYKGEIRRYYQQLEEYAASVEKFRKQALEYVNCMADLD